VEPEMDGDILTVDKAMAQLRDAAESAFEAEDRLVELLAKEGLLK
jgi:regulator of sigma D